MYFNLKKKQKSFSGTKRLFAEVLNDTVCVMKDLSDISVKCYISLKINLISQSVFHHERTLYFLRKFTQCVQSLPKCAEIGTTVDTPR